MKASLRYREMWLAYGMLLPPLLIVAAIVLFPVLANFWISFKTVGLAELRAPTPIVRERVTLDQDTGQVEVQYRLRNSSQKSPVLGVTLRDALAPGLVLQEPADGCQADGDTLLCRLGDWQPGHRERVNLVFEAPDAFFAAGVDLRASEPEMAGRSVNPLTSFDLTLDNFRLVFSQREFWTVLKVSLAYTIFGTLGALILGLFAALLLNTKFRGRGFLRGLFLFPYVSPVIAVAFTWVFFLDPFSGVFNALGLHLGVVESPVNFLGTRRLPVSVLGLTFDFPLALATVIVFEAWRYFPLSFLFILARLQALPGDLYEAAEVDGATPLQKFRYITFPQLVGILSILFMLRFIWTFNKFDDIFLLTGGAAGTRTFTVNVYEQGFALANLGGGAAVSVVIFLVLAIFMVFYFAFLPKGEKM